jgi:cytochrome bd ubiquinol oxidase subunit II
VTPANLLASALLAALVLYALFGGADYGAGFWDLLASGPLRREQRALIEHALGPIWEANHVWLILAVVLLFTGFPSAFAAVSIGLFVPLTLLLFGIVLRGAAFTFRTYDLREEEVEARWGYVFSASSAAVPVLLGVVVGTLASGRLRAGETDLWAFLAPFPLSVGAFALALFAFLAATYLSVEAQGALRDAFRRRAMGAGALVFAGAALSAALSLRDAPWIFRGLTARGFSIPLQVATGGAALTAFAALWRGAVRLGRAAAVAQVALIVSGWGASQYPYLVVPDLTIAGAAAPRATLVAVLWALAAGAVLLFPALYLLFRVFKGERPFAILDRAKPPPR